MSPVCHLQTQEQNLPSDRVPESGPAWMPPSDSPTPALKPANVRPPGVRATVPPTLQPHPPSRNINPPAFLADDVEFNYRSQCVQTLFLLRLSTSMCLFLRAAETEWRTEWTLWKQRAWEMGRVKAGKHSKGEAAGKGRQRRAGKGPLLRISQSRELTGGAWDLTARHGGWCLQHKPSDAIQLPRG